jgi:hypothetical protein
LALDRLKIGRAYDHTVEYPRIIVSRFRADRFDEIGAAHRTPPFPCNESGIRGGDGLNKANQLISRRYSGSRGYYLALLRE